jgi:hypothetical protein
MAIRVQRAVCNTRSYADEMDFPVELGEDFTLVNAKEGSNGSTGTLIHLLIFSGDILYTMYARNKKFHF